MVGPLGGPERRREMSAEFRFAMDTRVVDQITGLSGIIIGRTDSRDGTRQYHVQPTELHDGGIVRAEWLDEDRLTAVAASQAE